jgi:uncharacterized protein YcfJ
MSMSALLRNALALAGAAFVTQAVAEVSLYEREDFGGRFFTTQTSIENFDRYGFNDHASSAVVTGDPWEVCEDSRFGGRCVVLRPGRYPSLSAMGLNNRVSSVRAVDRNGRADGHRDSPAPPAAQVTFYENERFGGRAFTTNKQVADFKRFGFNDRASSVMVTGERWEVCDRTRFRGRCAVLRPGRYPSLASMGLNDRVSSMREVASHARIAQDRYAPAPIVAQITFYENERFGGRSFTTEQARDNFTSFGFNDRASSVVVVGEPWEACEHAGYQGRCVLLRAGRYPTMASMGLNNRVSSARVAGDAAPVATHDYRRRDNERTYEASVTSVRAMVGTPEQRCWVEPGQVEAQSSVNVTGAIAGAIIGGILGHQVGSGTGQNIATAGGAVAGAAIGANVGRTSEGQAGPDVQRCENVPGGAKVDYWDVGYSFRGQEHRVQMTAPPSGPTITVNEQGEPRA